MRTRDALCVLGAMALAIALGGCTGETYRAPDQVTSPSWSPDANKLAFVASRGGTGARVYSTDLTGERPAPRVLLLAWLINGPMAWSPDGSQLAVAGSDVGDDALVGHLWVAPVERERELQELAEGPLFWFPEWSPDGARLAYTESRTAYECALLVSTLDGHTEKVVEGPGTWLFLQWSPDGKLISYKKAIGHTQAAALGVQTGLYVCSVRNGSERCVVPGGAVWCLWLGPDELLVQCSRLEPGSPLTKPGVWSLNLATGARSLLLARDKLPRELKGGSPVPRWHRGTHQLLYSGTDEKLVAKPQAEPAPTAETPPSLPQGASTQPDYTYHIYRADLSAGHVRQLTSGPNSDTEPCWSPDGSRIAFVRNKTELWMMASDGSNQQKLLSVGELPL